MIGVSVATVIRIAKIFHCQSRKFDNVPSYGTSRLADTMSSVDAPQSAQVSGVRKSGMGLFKRHHILILQENNGKQNLHQTKIPPSAQHSPNE